MLDDDNPLWYRVVPESVLRCSPLPAGMMSAKLPARVISSPGGSTYFCIPCYTIPAFPMLPCCTLLHVAHPTAPFISCLNPISLTLVSYFPWIALPGYMLPLGSDSCAWVTKHNGRVPWGHGWGFWHGLSTKHVNRPGLRPTEPCIHFYLLTRSPCLYFAPACIMRPPVTPGI